MNTIEIKAEIYKIINKIPEEILPDILNYLTQFQDMTKSKTELSKKLKQILSDDKTLLEKLVNDV